jgi:hypothetical protein
MAAALTVSDSIQSAGLPLAFKVTPGTGRTALLGLGAARDTLKVEVRAMGGHQKECVVTEGEGGAAFRLVSDEGAALAGTDLAPFPLGFMNAGYQADLQGRIASLCAAHGIRIDAMRTEAVNQYAFAGSFYRGTGHGSALAPTFRVQIDSPAAAADLRALVAAAAGASPLLAAVRSPLINTFALYVNGRRRDPLQVPASPHADAPDPLKVWKGVPQPLAGAAMLDDAVVKIAPPPASAPMRAQQMQPDQDFRFDIDVRGETDWRDGTTNCRTWLHAPLGSTFGIRSDERPAAAAPCGLALAAAGVGFCLMTQLLRYTDYRKYNIRAVRLVQFWPMALNDASGGAVAGASGPLDTHVFLHGEESDENMGHLLLSAANTCYLHAMLGAALEPRIDLI